VIGKPCTELSPAEALSHVAAVTVVNDLTARDLQYRTHQWLAGKALDHFLPCGPALVTLDELPDLPELQIETRVNGETVQSAPVANMIIDVAGLVSSISQHITLVPGDLILTGTPGGVGSRREPPLWVDAGSTVEVEISQVGTLTNDFTD
jgi:2-keto-4-pentenoate hydratase/2-oxohepta-3-ene-1,7-dioic acid hydratase in catechol pathway